MSSPERLGDNRRVFIAVVREFQCNKPNRKEICRDIHKSNTMNYGHARRNKSGIASLDTSCYCFSRHRYAIPPPEHFAEPWKGLSHSRRKPVSCFILNCTRITFFCLICFDCSNPPCPIVDFHRIIHSHVLWRHPCSTIQSKI